jgi:RNA polymerase sigma-70 factor, ECF subfamily
MNYNPERTIARPSDPAAEQRLVLAAKNGDEQAFESLVGRQRHKILAVVRRYVHVREDAEDIVQQCFQKAFVHLCKFESRSSFSTWLTSIAVNEALMFLRSIGAKREIPIDDVTGAEGTAAQLQIPDLLPNPEASYLQQERKRILLSVMGDLRPGARQALELWAIAGFSMEETAERMGVSMTAVKTRLFRAKRELRQRLSRRLRLTPKFETSVSRMGLSTQHISQNQFCNASGF